MNRVFTKGFILLAVFLVILAGLSAVMLLLTPEEARVENFRISFRTIIFAVVLAFFYMLFHVFAGREGKAPLSLLHGMSMTFALYCAFVLGNVAVSHYLFGLSGSAYLATHILGFLALVGGGGALTILSLSAKEADTTASIKRSRLFVLTTRIGSVAEELNLCPYREMVSGIIGGLKDLKEAIRSSDPMSAGGEEKVVLAVGTLEDKCRRFMSLPSAEEREKAAQEIEKLIERAFEALKAGNEEVLHDK
ncbi:MAG: hypothetical protein JMJ95_13000 [Aminivibrio sp.]|nr:hypothetical protein [Aminivibrio sp.]